MSTEQPKALSILRTIQADNLLADHAILTMLKGLRDLMVYREKSFSDYFDHVQEQVGQLGHLQLRSDLDPISASSYLVDLTMGYERVLDDINRVSVEATAFLGRLKVVHNKAITLKAPFMVLWSIGATEALSIHTSVKINATDMKALAASEFTFLVNEADMELAAMIEAMELTLDNLKGLRKLAADKYSMGKDQVNAALSGLDFEDRGIAKGVVQSHKPAAKDTATMKGMFGDRVQDQTQPSTGEAPALAEGEDDFPHPAVDVDELDEPPTATSVTIPVERIMSAGQETPAELKVGHFPNGGVASEAEEEHFVTIEKRQEQMVATSHTMSEHPGQENLGPVDLDAPPTLVEATGLIVAPGTLIATPEGSKSVEELKVGDKVLVTGVPGMEGNHEVAAEIKPPQDYRLEKPGKGKPVVVFFNIDITACPPLVVPELLMGVGKTKLQLTAQNNPEENGVYRWHGAGSALVRIEEKAQDAPGPDTAPKPPKLVTPDVVKTVEPPAEPAVAPKTEPQVVTPDVRTTIQSDPFLSEAQKTEIVAKLDEEDDFPGAAQTPKPATGLSLDEDDFPTSTPEPNAQAPMDDDDDFPVGAEIIDRTPKPEDALEEKAPETPVLESTPAPEPPKVEAPKPQQVAAPKPDPAVAAPKPGGLFRSRTLPPNQTAAPAFRPSKPVEGAQVSGDGLDEVL